MEKNKELKLVFPDFNINESFANLIIIDANLYKRTNKLEMFIGSNYVLDMIDLAKFRNFLINKFKFTDVEFKINYDESLNELLRESINLQWKNIVKYMNVFNPMIGAFLAGSNADIDDDKLVINNICSEFANMIKNQKLDKYIHEFILNHLGIALKIDFDINRDTVTEIFQKEKDVIVKEFISTANDIVVKNSIEQQNKPKETPVYNTQKSFDKVYFPKNDGEQKNKKSEPVSDDPNLIIGRNPNNSNFNKNVTKLIDIQPEKTVVHVEGKVAKMNDVRQTKTGRFIVSFDIYDGTTTLNCQSFVNEDAKVKAEKNLKAGTWVKVEGNAGFNDFIKEININANTVVKIDGYSEPKRDADNADKKRVELHLHTQMSQLDAVTSASTLIKRAMSWGWKSIAITDHGVVQSFPEACHTVEGNDDFKVIYGVEGYLVPDENSVLSNDKGQTLKDTTYCVFDLETTGFSFRTEKITEIGIMKIRNGEIIDTFETFVNPEKPIPAKVQEVTHITDDMVKDAPKIEEVLPKVMEFFGDSVLVAHNADFDTGFLRYNCQQLGYKFENTYLDTLALAKNLFPNYKKYKLGVIAENLGIEVLVAHRALDDVDTTVKVFNIMCKMLENAGVEKLSDIDKSEESSANYKKIKSNHIIILAKNYVGLKNLYKLVSYSHVNYFFKKPLILKSILNKHREGLILGSACSEGELYKAILNGKPDDELEEIAKYYDYLEVQPYMNDDYLVRDGTIENHDGLKNIVRKIVELGEKVNRPVCATCDVHFMDPQDEIYRRMIQAGQKYADADNQAPLYLRNTEEMLEEFSYLGKEKAEEIVVTNTNLISDMCERISPLSPEKCAPHIPGCEKMIEDIAYDRAHELYGEKLPEIVESRLKRELDSIISNGFSVMYIIAQKLVWKSNEDGYIVGSRGSVGSSFVANMTGITEVNSLPPHYRCPNCKYSDFNDYGVKNGFDLPDKNCPKCGSRMDKDGMDIPFETFLGFNGDKEPDIDLNFSGEYQAKAHKYTEVIFGKGTTFKAGTVGTVKEKTAFGYVKKYYEEKGVPVSNAEIDRISLGCVGIKRTSGQHPGGIIVVPKGREIYEFTPVQHPADDPNSDIITTHFDYHSIDQNLLKLDILGHDDPTIIRMLYDLTGFDPTKVPLDDKETMSIYSSTEALGVTPEEIKSEVGTYGIPESGTKFVRGMLYETKPTTFEELIRISGLSHGTDVWLGNAQELINNDVAPLNQVICTRDDIMIYLIKCGLPKNTAFKIMELVRKGKVAKSPDKWVEFKKAMEEKEVPTWYIDSCNKIKYLFPKAHAAAYVTNAFRIAWFKVHIPKAYYCAYFTIRANAFDSEIMCNGQDRVRNKMREIELLGNAATDTDSAMYETLEIVNEMYARGIKFLPLDLYKSSATRFLMEDDGIRPPLNSLPGFGTVAAEGIEKARKEGMFDSIDELKIRAKLGKSGIELLRNAGCLKGMTESNQMSLFI